MEIFINISVYVYNIFYKFDLFPNYSRIIYFQNYFQIKHFVKYLFHSKSVKNSRPLIIDSLRRDISSS